MRIPCLLICLLLSSPALAQQPADPAFLQKALQAIEIQRNNALNAQAVAEAKLSAANEELGKARARIEELEPKKVEGDAKKK